ncbi:MAG: hypothetical protein WC479_01315 [Candidatus Izemoplasmatales bacterium]|jgi:uncharacterized protein Usg|nr:hypothetical protein [Candidatus Izemoplasmatales bacterium]MDD3865793.1 hypothetical protein [Candidatus Izemoplasmatales bacterium]
MKLLVTIVPRAYTDEIAAIIGGKTIDYQTSILGSGTATSEILEYLSLGETERSVIFSMVEDYDIAPIFAQLKAQLDFLKHGMGVTFAIPINAISKAGYGLITETLGGNHHGNQ